MELVTNLLGNIPTGTYEAVGAALVVSVLLQGLKNWLSLQSPKVITFLLAALSFVTVAIDSLLQTVSQNPNALGQKTAAVIGVATLVYRYAVKPMSNLTRDAKELREKRALENQGETIITPEALPESNPLLEDTDEIALDPDTPESVTPVVASEFDA